MVRWDLLLSLQHLGSPSSGDHDVMRGGSTVAGCAHCASSAVAAGSGSNIDDFVESLQEAIPESVIGYKLATIAAAGTARIAEQQLHAVP